MGALGEFLSTSGFSLINDNLLNLVMIGLACLLLYLAIGKKFEPNLLLPIAFGMLLANLPGTGLTDPPSDANNNVGGLLYYLDFGVKYGI